MEPRVLWDCHISPIPPFATSHQQAKSGGVKEAWLLIPVTIPWSTLGWLELKKRTAPAASQAEGMLMSTQQSRPVRHCEQLGRSSASKFHRRFLSRLDYISCLMKGPNAFGCWLSQMEAIFKIPGASHSKGQTSRP